VGHAEALRITSVEPRRQLSCPNLTGLESAAIAQIWKQLRVFKPTLPVVCFKLVIQYFNETIYFNTRKHCRQGFLPCSELVNDFLCAAQERSNRMSSLIVLWA